MTIYMKADDIKGGVTADGFKDEVQLSDVNFGMSRPVAGIVGKMSDRGSGTCSFSDVMCTKEVDFSTSMILKSAFEGTGIKVVLSFMTAGDKPQKYMEVTLIDAIISSHSIGGGGYDDKPVESFGLSFSKVEITFQKFDKQGKNPVPATLGYDLEKAIKHL
ncbi:MAG: type VI secretion system secreted protein Hcp [Halieaceae bacterium]|jgi:type VI secretion system secreted protein Hcp